jgi:DNA-binding response OmpR family regulator
VSVIWVVEQASLKGAGAALLGDFAVRAFASLASLEKLLRLARRSLPDLLIVDLDHAGCDARAATAVVRRLFPDTPCVLLSGDAAAGGATGEDVSVYVHPKPFESLRLSVFADFVIHHQSARKGAAARALVRYRDVLLNVERLEYMIIPGDEARALPLKEAQLLKFLLERPGACLSRDEISKSVWGGIKVTPRTIDSHVSRLRQRLSDAEVTIQAVYGGGYVLK